MVSVSKILLRRELFIDLPSTVTSLCDLGVADRSVSLVELSCLLKNDSDEGFGDEKAVLISFAWNNNLLDNS